MPSLTQGQLAPVPVVAVVALAPAVMLSWGWASVPLKALAATVRPVGPVLIAMVIASCVVYALSALVTGGWGAAMECARNGCGLMGLALVGQRVWGEKGAALAALGYLLVAFAMGRPSGGPDPAWWAWILLESSNIVSIGISATWLMIGVVLTPGLPRIAAVRP